MRPQLTRRPVFWVAFGALGVAGAVTALRLFSVALPTIALDITMDRGAAIERAAAVADENAWGAPEDRSAASFGLVDPEVQTYVELEGGGREEFARLAERGVYEPYQWRVRRFAERRVEESLVRFTPAGEPYGFSIQLAEDDPGSGNQDALAARAVAAAAAVEWGVDLGSYQLLESSEAFLPSGRVDHTFVFERTDVTLAEARFRLRIVVAGGEASELTHFVNVPQAFSRRYADMRSTNDSIALVSQSAFILLFVLLGAGVGSALLLKRGWLEWRRALVWGGIIAACFGLNTANQLPLSWMAYDTALSASSFVLQLLAGGVAVAIVGTPLIAFFLLAGESLGRRAFPDHLQQWRFWSPEVASSTTALGMTVAAYLLVGLQLGYVVLFYLGTQRLDAWWSPADALVQPDLLATYLPWLQAFSVSLFASFWEESVFRAVPIACAALLGARFGRRGVWIWGAVVLQAVVFAAGHANYPQQPPYARVIELTAPALLWGIVYLRFGLVPTILAHFLYDLSMISIVLFESNARVDQGIVVALALVPLGMIVRARVSRGGRLTPPEWAYNRAWSPAGKRAEDAVAVPTEPSGGPAPESASEVLPARRAPPRVPAWSIPVAGGVGLVLWLGAQWVRDLPPRLEGDRDEATAIALDELRVLGAPVDEWSVAVVPTAGPSEGRDYVWEEAGSEAFAALSGTYLDAPQWIVRLVDWEASAEERVEEYRVYVGAGGRVRRISHALPEARTGSVLDVDSARVLARSVIAARLGLDGGQLREVEAAETSRPNRADWSFTFVHVGALVEVEGEARVQARVAGDEVVDVSRTIRVPEEWERARREAESRRVIMAGGLALLLVICFAGGVVAAIVVWSRGGLDVRPVWQLGAVALVGLVASALNAWPEVTASFSTGQPRAFQLGSMAIVQVVLAAVAAPACGLVGALAHGWLPAGERRGTPRGSGVAFGLLVGGVFAAVPYALPGTPASADYSGAASALPFLDEAASVIAPYLLVTVSLLLFVAAREHFRERPRLHAMLSSLLAASAIVIVPQSAQASLLLWALAALVIGAALFGGLKVCSAHPELVPGIVGTAVVLDGLASSRASVHEGARIGGILAAVVVASMAWVWTRALSASIRPADHTRAGALASVGSE